MVDELVAPPDGDVEPMLPPWAVAEGFVLDAPVFADEFMLDEPVFEEEDAPGACIGSAGCMAEEPVVAEPEPVAVGRSVEGVAEVWARAGAAAKAVATRHAAMCFFSMIVS
jgi:hypothetical protein